MAEFKCKFNAQFFGSHFISLPSESTVGGFNLFHTPPLSNVILVYLYLDRSSSLKLY